MGNDEADGLKGIISKITWNHWTGLNWTGLDWTELDWTELDGIRWDVARDSEP